MMYEYKPKGTCSNRISFTIEDGVLHNVAFTGGCDGNLKAIATLAEGAKAEEFAARLKGIRCGRKKTSCADQFAQAIEERMENR